MYSKLKEEISKQNLTIRKVALKANIVPASLYAAINGNVKFWPGWRKRVAEALEVDEAEIFAEDKENDEG